MARPGGTEIMASKEQGSRVVVLGGGYGGLLAAVNLAGYLRPEGARITLINGRDTFVERIRLHQLVAGETLPERPLAEMLRGTGVELRVGRILGLDPAGRRVHIEEDGHEGEVAFDRALVALGSAGELSRVAGARAHGFDLGDLDDARRLAAKLATLGPGGRVVVCGGGLTGIEAATEIAERMPGLQVHLISSGSVGASLSAGGKQYVEGVLRGLGVTIEEGVRVLEVGPSSIEVARAGLSEQRPCDALLWAAGFAPSPLGKASGMAVSDQGQIVVDEALRSVSHPWISAAGDCASVVSRGIHLRMACATAMPMGAHAARSLASELQGRAVEPFRFGYAIQCVSLGRRRGIVQRVRPDDAPLPSFLPGRPAAWVKEAICRFTVAAVPMNRWVPGSYVWPRGPSAQPRPLLG
jgi:NADH dehydrogenase FAD-containing subunit